MPAALRLAIKSVFERPGRSALLSATVLLSAALIAAVSCAMASLNRALQGQMAATVGAGDIRLKAGAGGQTFGADLLERIERWPETAFAVARVQGSVFLTFKAKVWLPEKNAPSESPRYETEHEFSLRAVVNGVDHDLESKLRPLELASGRWAEADDEIVLDEAAARALSTKAFTERTSFIPKVSALIGGDGDSPAAGARPAPDAQGISRDEADARNKPIGARVGDEITYVRLLRKPVKLRLVGIVARPPLGGRYQAYMTVRGAAGLTEQVGRLTQIDCVLKPGFDPEATVAKYKTDFPIGLILQTTEKVTAGLRNNLQANELGFYLAATMAFLSAAFIITTGMTVGVTEKQRELAMLRCVGASRAQLAVCQLMVGGIIGGIGGLVGTPFGVGLAYSLVWYFKNFIPTGPAISDVGLVVAPVGSLLAGLIGAAVPAIQTARISPLEALAARSKVIRPVWLTRVTVAGLVCLCIHMAIVSLPSDGQVVFWGYATTGLPLMFTGYFLLGVPAVTLITRLLGTPVGWLLRLPKSLLARNVQATPYRHGFTAGAMMAGLALMVAIWTQGGSVLRDWLDKFQFPDAFVAGTNLTPETQRQLEAMPFVDGTCAITLQAVVPDQTLGVKALQRYSTTFIAFEPDPFFALAKLEWVQGDLETARRRLNEGGAVLVAREFLTARGLGVGSKFRCSVDGKPFEFDIVGVVTSPGLDIVSKFYNIGEEYTEQSLHAVFGSRRDLKDKFGSEVIHLIQIGLREKGERGAVPDEQAIATIRRELSSSGIIDAGSGRRIKEQIADLLRGGLVVASTIAVFSMLVASLGVANLIIAGITARRFEFGVLRSVGASAWLVSRLVLGEAIIISVAACLLGTLMGFQGAYSGRRIQAMLLGLELTFSPPFRAIAIGWTAVAVLTIGAAAPAVILLARRRPRELIGGLRG